MLMNSVLHSLLSFSLQSDSVGRLAVVMALVCDLSWKMIYILMYSICFCLLFCKAHVPHLVCILQYRSDD